MTVPSTASVAKLLGEFQRLRDLRQPAAMPNLSVEEATGLLDAISLRLGEARRTGELASPWAAAGIGRKEVRNAAVVAWLLDPMGSHGHGALLLQAFLDLVGGRWRSEHRDSSKARVHTEYCALDDLADRVDVVIEGDSWRLFVEVKIDAAEGEAQLERYAAKGRAMESLARATGRDYDWELVFLSPRAPLLDHGLRHLTWRQIAQTLREASRRAPPIPAFLINSFARHVRAFH